MKPCRTHPSRRALQLMLALGALSLLVLGLDLPSAAEISVALGLLLIIGFTMEYLDLRALPELELRRFVPANLALNRKATVEVTIVNRFEEPRAIDYFDMIDATMAAPALPVQTRLPAGKSVMFKYRLKPFKRGPIVIPAAEIRITSRWSLWQAIFKVECESRARVFPDFSAIAQYVLLTTLNRSEQLGILKRPRRGEGTEFNNLREYRTGDTLRQVNWKASSRLQKLISEDYHHESDQQIVVLLDCGRRMLTVDEGVSHFDLALNALILVSYIALRMGDAIGVMSFGKTQRWIPARKGPGQTNNILRGLYDVHAESIGSDYSQAVKEFLKRQKKRCLLILITNLRDEDSQELNAALSTLKNRHVLLVANIEEAVLGEEIRKPVESFPGAIRYSGVQSYLEACHRTRQQLSANGVLNVSCTGASLPVKLANSYLDVKQARIL